MDELKSLRSKQYKVKLTGANLLNSMQDVDSVCIYTVDVLAEEFEEAIYRLKECEKIIEKFLKAIGYSVIDCENIIEKFLKASSYSVIECENIIGKFLKASSYSVIDVNIDSPNVFKTFFKENIKPVVVKFRFLQDFFCDCAYLQNLPYFKDLSISNESTDAVVGAEVIQVIQETVEVDMPIDIVVPVIEETVGADMVVPHTVISESNFDVSDNHGDNAKNKISSFSFMGDNHNTFCNRNYRIVTFDELLIGFSPEDFCDSYYETRDIVDIESVSGDVLSSLQLSTRMNRFGYIGRSFSENTFYGDQRCVLLWNDSLIKLIHFQIPLRLDLYSDDIIRYFTEKTYIFKFCMFKIMRRRFSLDISHFHEGSIFNRTFSRIVYIYFDRGKTHKLKWMIFYFDCLYSDLFSIGLHFMIVYYLLYNIC